MVLRVEISTFRPKISVFPLYLGPGAKFRKTVWHTQTTAECESTGVIRGKSLYDCLIGAPLNLYPYLGSPNSGLGKISARSLRRSVGDDRLYKFDEKQNFRPGTLKGSAARVNMGDFLGANLGVL